MDSPMPSSLIEIPGILEDPRVDRTKPHPLTDILFLSVLSVLCSTDSFVAIAKPLPHLRPSQIQGQALWMGGTLLAHSGCQNAILGALTTPGLARHPPVPARVAPRRHRPGRALPGAAGHGRLFRTAAALGPGLVGGHGTDPGHRPHLQGCGPGGPDRERGLPGAGHPRGLAPQARGPTRALDVGSRGPAGLPGTRRAAGHDRARALRPGPAEPPPVDGHPSPGLASTCATTATSPFRRSPAPAGRPSASWPGPDSTR